MFSLNLHCSILLITQYLKFTSISEFKSKAAELELIKESHPTFISLRCQQIWKKIYGSYKAFNLNTKLELKMIYQNDRNFLAQLVTHKIKLPNIKRIKIDQNKKEDYSVKSFFKYCFPDQVELFCYNWDHSNCNQTKLSFYFDEFKQVLPRVTREVFINNLYIEKKDFESIISITKARRLVFHYCKFDTSTKPTFYCSSPNIQYLSFQLCGQIDLSDWKTYPSKLRNIFKGLSESGLKSCIQTLNVHRCRLSQSKVRALIQETYGLSIDTVNTEDWIEPLED
ncbi:unnamed protein product [Moneuplotes crassus]|uniref:Uncharacterized protein n=1 Tax=Euplotes crassus TaxID=5936 RepID=A0AAD2DCA0_EUPCR|nr:unnamed protein product [Moneuplotes crassus]